MKFVYKYTQGIAFVVDEKEVQRAYDKLHAVGFSPCSQGAFCEDSPEKKRRFNRAPSKDLHISESVPIMLYKKSEMLWNIPDLAAVTSELTTRPDIILASDPKRLPGPDIIGNNGRFPLELHPIRIPSGWRIVEACTMLLRRDRKVYGPFWMTYLYYMAEYVPDKNVLDEDDLEPTERDPFMSLKYDIGNPWDYV